MEAPAPPGQLSLMRFLPRREDAPHRTSPGPGTLLDSGLPHLIDERSDPDFRTVYGTLARHSAALDAAVVRIRLTGLDLGPDELQSLERVRVLLAEVNGLDLRSEAEAMLLDPRKARNVRNLASLMEAGRIDVRSAPLAGWAPDFSVFHRKGRPWTLLAGLHWFARPFPHRGPALASLHGAGAAARTAARFSELWKGGHDIGPAILELLREADRRSNPRCGSGRRGANTWPGPAGRPTRKPTARQGRSPDRRPPKPP